MWSVSPKSILILPKNFLNFWLGAVQLQSIINFSRYGSKGYTSVVLCNSEVTFLGEKEDAAFCLSFYCVLVIYGVAVSEECLQIPWSSILLGYFLLIFINTTPRSSWVNCYSLMSSWLSIIFEIGLTVTLGDFLSRFLKYSFHMYIRSSWLATFSLALEVFFLLLIYCLSCHLRLSIFHWIHIFFNNKKLSEITLLEYYWKNVNNSSRHFIHL